MIKFFIYLTTILVYLTISSSAVMGAKTMEKAALEAQIPASAYVRVFGYTAPLSVVQVTGTKSYGQTNSDRKGYFLIEDLPVSDKTQELCAQTIDRDRRTGFPVCFPVNPERSGGEIGPILLSPTLSLSAANIWQNQNEHASGKTIPGQKVHISLFETPVSGFIISQAYAASLPDLETISDKEGNFSFSLPTANAYTYRVYVTSNFQDAPTPKSPTVTYMVGPIGSYFVRFILPKVIGLFILACVLIAVVIYDHKTAKVRKRAVWFIEKKLRPFEVRSTLLLRLLWYNFRRQLLSGQSRHVRKNR